MSDEPKPWECPAKDRHGTCLRTGQHLCGGDGPKSICAHAVAHHATVAKAAEEAVKAEREACAVIVDKADTTEATHWIGDHGELNINIDALADAIRARGGEAKGGK
jgi:hypothetical protein